MRVKQSIMSIWAVPNIPRIYMKMNPSNSPVAKRRSWVCPESALFVHKDVHPSFCGLYHSCTTLTAKKKKQKKTLWTYCTHTAPFYLLPLGCRTKTVVISWDILALFGGWIFKGVDFYNVSLHCVTRPTSCFFSSVCILVWTFNDEVVLNALEQ